MPKTVTAAACKVTGFEIPVEDKARATKFYTDVFGWSVQAGEKEHAHIETVEMDSDWIPKEKGAINGMLYKKTSKNDKVALMVTVESIEDTLENVKKQNGNVVTPRTQAGDMGWWAEITDTEGNLFELWEDMK